MTTLLSILFLLIVFAIGLWATWNAIAIAYHAAMITICGIAYVSITIWEVLTAANSFMIVRPARALVRLVR